MLEWFQRGASELSGRALVAAEACRAAERVLEQARKTAALQPSYIPVLSGATATDGEQQLEAGPSRLGLAENARSSLLAAQAQLHADLETARDDVRHARAEVDRALQPLLRAGPGAKRPVGA